MLGFLRKDTKVRAIVLLVLAVFAIMWLASGIADINLRSGPSYIIESDRSPIGEAVDFAVSLTIAEKRVISATLVALMVLMALGLFKNKSFRRVVVTYFFIIMIFIWGTQRIPDDLKAEPVNSSAVSDFAEELEKIGEAEKPAAPEPSAETLNLISWLIRLTGIALIGGIAYWFYRNRQRQQVEPPLEKLAKRAERAIVNIETGGNLREAILFCYRDMSQMVQNSRGLGRDEGMTAREFETQLMNNGLPQQAVTRLTRLFESARYGKGEPTKRDELEAVASLRQIIQVVRQAE